MTFIENSTENNGYDILFWASISPEKYGSFENFICRLASKCEDDGLKLLVVLGYPSDQVIRMFKAHKVEYRLITNTALNSPGTIFRFIKETKPKIVHLHFISYCSLIIPVCRLMGVRLILTEHTSLSNNDSTAGLLDSLKALRRWLCGRMVNRFIAVSDFVADCLVRGGKITPKKITTIHNSVDLERFSPVADALEKAKLKRQLFHIDGSRLVVTFVGQLIPEKGIFIFIKAARKLLEKHTNILFVVIGKGKEALAENNTQQNNSNIIFLGTRDDVEIFLKASDIFVCPSIWQEAFGYVLAEAAACGLPVVTSNTGAIPEIILHSQTGLLVLPGDFLALAAGMEMLVSNKEMSEKFGCAGREHALKHFGMEKMISKTIALYRREINI